MRRIAGYILGLLLISGISFAQEEPPLGQVLADLGLFISPEDEIYIEGPTQGTFIQAERDIQILLVAKHSLSVDGATTVVDVGYYAIDPVNTVRRYATLFTCGPEADNRTSISGLPVTPNSPVYLKQGLVPIGFYVQSANFNPSLSYEGETVYTQDALNSSIERFGNNLHKARVFPYRDLLGVRPHWYVICWEFSTNDDFQDVITVVRGVDILIPHVNLELQGQHFDPNPLVPNVTVPITPATYPVIPPVIENPMESEPTAPQSEVIGQPVESTST